MQKVDLRNIQFKKWMKSADPTTYASFVAAQEIVRHRDPFTDGESSLTFQNTYLRTLQTRVKLDK